MYFFGFAFALAMMLLRSFLNQRDPNLMMFPSMDFQRDRHEFILAMKKTLAICNRVSPVCPTVLLLFGM